jgi:hypothetical protein
MTKHVLRWLSLVALLGATQIPACTVGVFSGRVMSDGRPVIWKNRDVEGVNQAIRYFTDGRYPYVGLIWAGEPNNVWGGLNEVGFGIMNSNTFNLGAGAPQGFGDGQVMKLALQTCATIADFQLLLDSVVKVGLVIPCNLGVMDSTGATAFFESGAYVYYRWDTDSQPEGYMVRANFSLSADTVGRSDNARYLRALQLVSAATGEHRMSREYLIDTVARDLGGLTFDPYPLPFEGRVNSFPRGYLPTNATICRTKTRAGLFITGRRPGEPVGLSTMWTILGQPLVGVPVPLWVGARSVPREMYDHPTAALTDITLSLRAAAYHDPDYPEALDSYPLADIADALATVKQDIAATTVPAMREWNLVPPDSAELARFQQEKATQALSAEMACYTRQSPIEQTSTGISILQVAGGLKTGLVDVTFPGDPRNRSLSVYSAAGRRLVRFDLTAYPHSGNCSIRWQPAGLPSGLYLASLDRKGERRTVSFAYLRR